MPRPSKASNPPADIKPEARRQAAAADELDAAEGGDSHSSAETNRATGRVLDVLSEFGSTLEPMGVTEVSERLGMSKNMAFRALSTLVDQGYLIRSEAGRRYELGFRILELSNPDAAEPDLRTLAMPTMSLMQAVTGETVVLTIKAGNLVVAIDGIEANATVRSRAPVGSMFPLHASPAARVVLAAMTDDEIDEYLKSKAPLVKLAPATITDPDSIRREVRRIRKDGFAKGFGDANPDRRSLSFAILDGELRPWGSITVGGPKERFTDEKVEEVTPQLKKLMSALNEQTRLFSAPTIESWAY
jgi:DNA-binding IclR family transcriptional regulator